MKFSYKFLISVIVIVILAFIMTYIVQYKEMNNVIGQIYYSRQERSVALLENAVNNFFTSTNEQLSHISANNELIFTIFNAKQKTLNKNELLEKNILGNSHIYNAVILDPNFEVMAYTDLDLSKLNNEAELVSTLQQAKIDRYNILNLNFKEYLFFGQAIKRNETILGYIYTAMDIDEFPTLLLTSLQRITNEILIVFDEQNKIVFELNSKQQASHYISDALLNSFRKNKENSRNLTEIELSHQNFQLVYNYDKYGLSYLSLYPKEKIISETYHYISKQLIMNLFIGMFVIFVFYLFTRQLLNFFKKYIDFAKASVSGKNDSGVDIHRKDELGEFARTLQTLVNELFKSLEEAEQKRLEANSTNEKIQMHLQEIERMNFLMQHRENKVLSLKAEVNEYAALLNIAMPYPSIYSATNPQAQGSFLDQNNQKKNNDQPITELDDNILIVQSIENIIDIKQLESVLESFCASSKVSASILDIQGNFLAQANWNNICGNFFRKTPPFSSQCKDIDLHCSERIQNSNGEDVFVKCSQGLWSASSAIYFDNIIVGEIRISQFHLDSIDEDYYKQLAIENKYNADDFLEKIKQLQILTKNEVSKMLNLLKKLVDLTCSVYQENQLLYEQSKKIEEFNRIAISLAEDAEQAHLNVAKQKEILSELVHERTKELYLSQEKMRLLLSSAPEAIFGLDLENKITFANQTACAYLDKENEIQIINIDISELISFEPEKTLEQEIFHWNTNKVLINKGKLVFSSGKTSLPVELTNAPIINENENIGSVIIIRDLSESHDYMETLSAIYNSSRDAQFIINDQKIINNCNTSANELFTDSLVGMPLVGFLTRFCPIQQTNEELSSSLAHVEKAFENGYERFEHTFSTKSGEHIETYVSLTKINLQNGTSVTFNIHDLTSLKQKENELLLAKNIAEESVKVKTEFIARMSHELRTPINAILGMSYLCLQTNLNIKQQEYLNTIQVSAGNLLALINSILDFSKLDSGQLYLDKAPFALSSIVSSLVAKYKVIAEEKDLKFTCTIGEIHADNYYGDGQRISQIIDSLVKNGIKFTEQGTVQLQLYQEADLGKEIILHIQVSDTGIGMSETSVQKIFGTFEQVGEYSTRKYGGTGLGLALIKKIIQIMGGEISVQSELGVGTLFDVSLRLQKLNQYHALITNENKNVLMYVSSGIIGDALREFLSNQPINLEESKDLAKSLENIQLFHNFKSNLDLIILDTEDYIKELHNLLDIIQNTNIIPPKILVLVNNKMNENDILDLNNIYYLKKPINISSVYNMLLEIFPSFSQSNKSNEENIENTTVKILLAEDNEINQEIAVELLATLGIDVDVACNGQEAIDKVKQNSYDLILMDIQMPIMDGLEAASKISALNKDIPIIAMTAHASDEDRKKSLQAGMLGHLTKPIDPNQLKITLIQYIPKLDSQFRAKTIEKPIEVEIPSNTLPTANSEKAIQIEHGIANVAGNQKLYIKLLAQFMLNYGKTANYMEDLLNKENSAEELEEAKRLMHSIKGVASNLGADNLAIVCGSIESKMKKNNLPSTGDLERLKDALKATLDHIEVIIKYNTIPDNMSEHLKLSNNQVIILLDILKSQIDVDWGEVINRMDEISDALENSQFTELCEQLSLSVENFDTDLVIDNIEKLKAQLEMENNENV